MVPFKWSIKVKTGAFIEQPQNFWASFEAKLHKKRPLNCTLKTLAPVVRIKYNGSLLAYGNYYCVSVVFTLLSLSIWKPRFLFRSQFEVPKWKARPKITLFTKAVFICQQYHSKVQKQWPPMKQTVTYLPHKDIILLLSSWMNFFVTASSIICLTYPRLAYYIWDVKIVNTLI